jgi:hypothetical protein
MDGKFRPVRLRRLVTSLLPERIQRRPVLRIVRQGNRDDQAEIRVATSPLVSSKEYQPDRLSSLRDLTSDGLYSVLVVLMQARCAATKASSQD